jgi:hypothetical protein
MTTPTGTISADNIRTEFGASGANNSVSLGAYRVSVSVGNYSNLPLDDGIPQGTDVISFNNFRGKSLNVVLDIGTDNTEYRVNLKTKYENSTPTMIGGYATKPINTSGKKIKFSVNKTIGSAAGSITNVALRTGSWDSGTSLQLIIGSNGRIYGSGGAGGNTTYSEANTVESSTQCFCEPSIHFRPSDQGWSGPFWGDGANPSDPTGPNGEAAYNIGGFYPGSPCQIGDGGGYYQACRDFQYTTTSRSYGATSGSNGTSAIGIDYPIIIQNYGLIQNGYGGGGGGSYATATQ